MRKSLSENRRSGILPLPLKRRSRRFYISEVWRPKVAKVLKNFECKTQKT